MLAAAHHITALHTRLRSREVGRHLEKVCVGHSPPRPGASCAGRLSLDTGARRRDAVAGARATLLIDKHATTLYGLRAIL